MDPFLTSSVNASGLFATRTGEVTYRETLRVGWTRGCFGRMEIGFRAARCRRKGHEGMKNLD